ncbi:synaptotagmin-like protein 4 isoform X4 [Drosophila rhopaloa]|uniref:Synaptotagmin-like protein 4 isoform X3 n=1 Tax=Drosophila rhopaloa TaxID=1041015 RepID=A0A6P4EKQ9_DRORH|nr:synaptotagmin-like protein 4 isoform X4 [Drosophila rhopaloa]
MKQVTRLIGPRRTANSAPKEATSYNVFASTSAKKSQPASAAPAPLARVHNYGRVVSQPAGSSLPSSSAGKIQYAALNRMRKKRSGDGCKKPQRKSKWRHLFGQCWWKKRRRQRSYQDYWSRSGGKPRKSHFFCYCCRKRSNGYHYDSDEEDDDIDAKVASYVIEMKQREAEANRQSERIVEETAIPVTQEPLQQLPPPLRSPSVIKRRAWTWDDSLRSNSDRFLETLEEDLPANAAPGGRTSLILHRRTPLHVTFVESEEQEAESEPEDHPRQERVAVQEEAKVAAEELTRSPVIGQRQADGTGSPIQSRASSETWPTQSDEDIDRLVAMHQNRSSLSSLGVRSESMASVYSGAGEGRYGTVVVKGQVEFAMQYNYKLSALEIHVVRCKDLAAVDAKRNRSDPYVKVYLLPDKSKAGKRKTKVKKHTLNPIFDETMRFHTPISSLESRTLWLTVWHSDMFGRNDFLGEVSVNLQGRLFDNPQSQWYLLQERSEPFDEVATYRGDIVVGLKYIPPESIKSSFFSRGSSLTGSSSNLRKFGGSIKSVASKSDRTSKGGQLHVLVKEAKHLSPIKANGTCDAFCKSYLLPDRTRSSKQKTPVVKRTLHPSWNYTFVYEDVSLEELSERALELTVWDHDRLASNEFVGGIRFSLGTGRSYGRQVEWMDATGKELSLWQNMLDRPNFWVEGSLVLRSTLDGIRANLP